MKLSDRIAKKFSSVARKNQVYIVPTIYGGIFLFAIIFILFVGAVYNNNLVNLLAFFLASIIIVSMVQTHDNLKGVKLKMIRATSGFADSFIMVETTLENPTKTTRFNLDVRLPDLDYYEDIEDGVPISAFSRNRFQSVYRTKARGLYKIKRAKISTVYPLGLFYAWTYTETYVQYFVYPSANGKQALPMITVDGENSNHRDSLGEDFSGHRDYQNADSPNRIDWKAFARGRGVLIKEFRSGSSQSLILDYKACTQPDIEDRLQQLSQWIETCRKKEIAFAVRLPDQYFATGTGTRHVQRILEELARFDGEAS